MLTSISLAVHSIQFSSLQNFGDNPGQLSASYYTPSSQPSSLVVLLHGCVQDAQQLAINSGLLGLVQTHNVGLLLPQQHDSNNIKRCFNWFSPADTDKDSGETRSIINMIKHYKKLSKAQNVYIVGLSAGGAMTSNLLIHYPQLFSAGAIIAGVPYPCANNLIKAIACMRSGPSGSVNKLLDSIPSTTNKWPPLSVWTGLDDKIVSPNNAYALAKQWQLLSAAGKPKVYATHEGYRITIWPDSQQQSQVQLVEIENFGHAIAIVPQQHGATIAPFIQPAPLSSATELFKLWQLSSNTLKNNRLN